MARPKANPMIKLMKRFNELQVKNEKLQADIADVLDEITKELDKQVVVPQVIKANAVIKKQKAKSK